LATNPKKRFCLDRGFFIGVLKAQTAKRSIRRRQGYGGTRGAGHTEKLSQKKDKEHDKRMFQSSYLIFPLSPEPYALGHLALRMMRWLEVAYCMTHQIAFMIAT
jgi:hypothetical protein